MKTLPRWPLIFFLLVFAAPGRGAEGTHDGGHWAFQPPDPPPPPDVSAAWVANEIDCFIAAEHERRGLQAAGEADRGLLLRRVSLDLVGLPPTREELRAFLADETPHAYQTAVDRLLARPEYGQRWARHWMDVWRYSDPSGYGKEIRDGREHIWRWRDWIVEALNEDKGYDRMVVEMLAADEAAPDDLEALRATGFLARNWYKFNRNVWLDNIVEHSSKAFLGMTVNCARCHDHKFDPIAQREYFQLRAFFEPHDLRDDPPQDGANAAMLVRAYDAHPATPTYLFEQGDERKPNQEQPLQPRLPAMFSVDLEVKSVDLPVVAFYPALRPEVQRAALAAADEEVALAKTGAVAAGRAADEALAEFSEISPTVQEPDSESRPADENATTGTLADDSRLAPTPAEVEPVEAGTPPEVTDEAAESRREDAQEDARAKAEIAHLHLAATEAARTALAARYAAEQAKFGLAADEDEEQLARAAGAAERLATARRANELIARARQQIVEAKRKQAEGDAAAGKALETAEKDLAEHTKLLADAENKPADGTGGYQALGPVYPRTSTGRRLALARWITNRNNPLAARVAVNHIWLRHFDEPLVERMDDFGLRSPKSDHADLLDWLAVRFMEDGWSMKRLHKLIVTSGVYRMRSSAGIAASQNRDIDRDNRLFWRQNVRRMEAETVRDSVLHLGGDLDVTTGGPPIDHDRGQDVRRRSMYFRQDKERQMVFLSLFDGAKVNECYRRMTSVTPQQALAMYNSEIASTQAARIAARIGLETGDDGQFVTALFEQVLCRQPRGEETAKCLAFLSELPDRTRARRQLALVLLNHNDFVTIR